MDILREKIPTIRNHVPIGNPGVGFGDVVLYQVDASKSVRILGLSYCGLADSIVDSAQSFLDIEELSS